MSKNLKQHDGDSAVAEIGKTRRILGWPGGGAIALLAVACNGLSFSGTGQSTSAGAAEVTGANLGGHATGPPCKA